MINDLGSLSLAVIVPGAASAAAACSVACGIAAPNVNAQLTAMASFTPQVNLSLAAQLSIAQNIVANIEAAISAGLVPPSLSAQVALAASITADLQAMLLTIQAQLNIALALQGVLATAGVRLLTYSGQQNSFGSELATALGGSTANCNAIVVLTTNSSTWTTMGSLFKTS